MEHRCSTRRPVTLDAFVEYRALGRVPGRIRNISVGGVFVEIGPRRPPVNSLVDLCFSVPHEGGGCRCRISAMVVQQTDRGIGLMFDDLSAETFGLLKGLIDAGARPRSYNLPVYAVR